MCKSESRVRDGCKCLVSNSFRGLRCKVSAYVDEIGEHSVRKTHSPSTIFFPFQRKTFVLTLVPHPLCFAIKSGQMSQNSAAERRLYSHTDSAVEGGGRERGDLTRPFKNVMRLELDFGRFVPCDIAAII